MRLLIWIAVGVLLVAACAPPDSTQLADNNISIVIPYRPGGGFDVSVRTFAPYFAKQLGEDINILPTNLPGAGGRRGATTVYRAKPDGTTLGIFNLPGIVLPRILGEEVQYDLQKLSWIGRLESQNYLLLVASSSELRSVEDLQKLETISFLSTGYGSSVLTAMQILSDSLGLEDKNPIFLTGYAGTADYLVGLIRGDGNVALAPVSTAIRYVESGDLRALAVTGEVSEPEGVPTFAELGYPELTPLNVQRSIAGPPDMNPELLKLLRDAFTRAVSDPEFKEAALKARLYLSPLDGEQAAAQVDENFSFYEKFKADLKNPNTF